MKVKEESEKVGLKLKFQKTRNMASGLITSWEIDGETVETVSDVIFWCSKITADVDCSMFYNSQDTEVTWTSINREMDKNVEKVKVKSLSHVWLFATPMDCSPPGSSVHGIFQARVLEWVAISFSRRSSGSRDQTRVSWVSCIGRWTLYHWATWEAC